MKISVILSHPNKGSFNHALATAAAEGFRAAGHEVVLHDLHAEGFDPIYGAEEAQRGAILPPEIEGHVSELCAAEGLVIVHPNFWSRPPAMMCGWADRVLRAGRAYQFVPDGKGGARPQGLLKLKFVLVLNTANTPQEKELAFNGDPLEQHWKKIVFGLCGVSRVERQVFSSVIMSTPEQRAAWLAEVRTKVAELATGGV